MEPGRTNGPDRRSRPWSSSLGCRYRVGHGSTIKLPHAVTSAQFSPDGAMILTVAGREVTLWKTASGKPVAPGSLDLGQDAELLSSAFSPGGSRL